MLATAFAARLLCLAIAITMSSKLDMMASNESLQAMGCNRTLRGVPDKMLAMPDYDLTRLGPRAFEQMVVALARKEIGPGVHVFGDGKDGGREATFEGTINWSATSADMVDCEDTWTGFTVLQAKFQVKPKPQPYDNAIWLQDQIKKEIAAWSTAAKEHTRSRLPDYLIFVTNLDLSPVAKTGGIDTITELITGLLSSRSQATTNGLSIKGFMIWHADQIRSMLDGNQDVRWAFPGLLTAGDVMSLFSEEHTQLGTMDLRDPIREELLRSLHADRWIRLSQSGGPGDAKLWLDDIAIDLPAILDDERGTEIQAVRHVLELGDTVLRRRQPDCIKRPNVVIVGGPGQGKSTLSQLIAQTYRLAMLSDADVAPGARSIIDGTHSALTRLGLKIPANRRWPVRIDLARYAEELSTGACTTLLRWVSAQVSQRTSQDITPNRLREWLRTWPWALILDGLDEVPSLGSRRRLYQEIDSLLATAEDVDADLLIVVTTRPTGYDEHFAEESFHHLRLSRLPTESAISFATHITAKRFKNDDDMHQKVAARMVSTSNDATTRRLMETPLQVTMMSFIVEKYPTLPPDRFTLFDLYYRTVYEREVAKDIPIARFLSDNRAHIDQLHQQVGLLLQVESETAQGAEAALDSATLGTLATKQLHESGFDSDQAARYASQLVEATTHRLVLLTPRDKGIGFEIRSLQELMAARAIVEADDNHVVERLKLIAHSPHWRNTWLLSAGRLLVQSPRFERLIVGLLKSLDTDPHRLGARFPTAPSLAADILNDNLAILRPNFERSLIQSVFAALDRPPVGELRHLAETLLKIASGNYRAITFERIATAVNAGAARRAAAGVFLYAMDSLTVVQGPQASVRLAFKKLALTPDEDLAIKIWEAMTRGRIWMEEDHPNILSYLDDLFKTLGLSEDEMKRIRDGLNVLELSKYRLQGSDPSYAIPIIMHKGRSLLDALKDDDIATALDLALETLPPSHWAIEAMIGGIIRPAQIREPVGAILLDSISASQMDEQD